MYFIHGFFYKNDKNQLTIYSDGCIIIQKIKGENNHEKTIVFNNINNDAYWIGWMWSVQG